MTTWADLPGAAELAAVYQRFAEAVSSGGLGDAGEPLAADLLRYAAAAGASFVSTPATACCTPGDGRLRAALGPWLRAAESAYQQWAHSPAARDFVAAATVQHALSDVPTYAGAPDVLGAAVSALGLPSEPMPRTMIHADGHARLYRYGDASCSQGPPLLIVYAMINRPSILDLEPERSFIRGLVAGGRDVYLLDWGDPDGAGHEQTLADLLDGALNRAVRAVGGRRKVDLLGVCQGGVFALVYAARYPHRVRRLVTVVTPVDFHTHEDLLSHWARGVDPRLLQGSAAVPGFALGAVFQALAPYRLSLGKYVDLLDHAHDPDWLQRFRRMERWVHDCPDQPRRIFAEFLREFYQENRLMRGLLMISDRVVDLREIRVPVLNIYGLHDHLVPPAASRALATLTQSSRYDEVAVPAGHIGVFVSGRASDLPERIARWLARR